MVFSNIRKLEIKAIFSVNIFYQKVSTIYLMKINH